MKTLIIVLCILAIVYFIIAKVVNQIAKNDNPGRPENATHIPDSWAFLLVPIFVAVGLSFLTIVPAQQCGVVVTPAGVKQETYNTGWHIVMPWYKVELMEKTAQVYTCAKRSNVSDKEFKQYKADATQSETVWTPTIDGIKMGFDISASWRIDPTYAWWIYDNVSATDDAEKGRFYWLEENVIKPKLKSALALTTSQYTPIQVYSTSREQIQYTVLERIKKDILSYHLILDQIDIREVYYNSEYEEALNKKKLEEQKALTLVEVTKQKEELKKQAEIDKDIKITQSQGEAEALRIKGQSVASNPKIVELEWINKWNGELPQYMFGGSQGIMLNMPNMK